MDIFISRLDILEERINQAEISELEDRLNKIT